ncbi:MAG: lipoyl(octanoyl) transferase LipB [Actinomycetes bacterium]
MSSTTTPIATSGIALKRQGLIDYQVAWDSQRRIHEGVANGTRPNTLILLEHPSVYTAGRRTEDHERPMDGTPVINVDRGGKITWHGPGQLVGYPIIKLRQRNEVVGFVREIETALIAVCQDLGINAERYCERSGVWLRDEKGDRKIAAIGIRVAKGVTMHGFALNVNPDLASFGAIVPCGFTDSGVTSISQELGRSVTIDEVAPLVEKYMYEALSRVAE